MIRITRGDTRWGRAMGYKIYIDNIYRDKIKINTTKEFEVENGSHAVYASLYRTEDDRQIVGSKVLYVDVNDSIVELEVDTGVVGWKRSFWPYTQNFIKRDERLLLREKYPTDPRQIRVTRNPRREDWVHDYRVYINGIYRGGLAPGATESFPVENNGVHTVRVAVDWRRSNKITVDVNDSIVELEVGSAVDKLEAASPVSDVLYSTIFWFKYLWLREK